MEEKKQRKKRRTRRKRKQPSRKTYAISELIPQETAEALRQLKRK